MKTIDIFEGLATQSEVRPNFLTLRHFHLNKIRNFSKTCLALHAIVERWEYSHNKDGDSTGDTQLGLSRNLKLDTNPPS